MLIQNSQPYFLLLGLLVIGFISRNKSIMTAAAVLLVLRLLCDLGLRFEGLGVFHAQSALDWLDKNGLRIGVIILTIGILAPIAKGEITWEHISRVFVSPVGWVALLIGIFASFAAGRGVDLMSVRPQVVPSIIIGIIAGVAFFKGVPSGPLIASGILAIVVYLASLLGFNL